MTDLDQHNLDHVAVVNPYLSKVKLFIMFIFSICSQTKMPHCAVAVCKSPSGVSYHRFPKDPKLRKVWVLACKRKDYFNEDTARVCENHFLASDFERDLKNELLNLQTKKILKKGAFPSTNLLTNPNKRPASSEREERLSKRIRKEIVQDLCSIGK